MICFGSHGFSFFGFVTCKDTKTPLFLHTFRYTTDKAKTAADRTRELCIEKSAKIGYLSENIVDNVGDGFFSQFNIVIGCIDNLEARLAISRGCWLAGIPWVDGSISGYHGNVVVFKPFETFCFYCTMSDDDKESIKTRYSCDHRKIRARAENKIPTIQTLSSIIAGIQVQEALRLLHYDYSMIGKRIGYNGTLNLLETSTSHPLTDHDNHHGTYVGEEIEKLSWGSADNTLEFFLKNTGLSDGEFELMLSTRPKHDFIFTAECKICSNKFDIDIPLFRLFGDQYNKCPYCGAEQSRDPVTQDDLTITFEGVPVLTQNNLSEKMLGMRLLDIGFAPLDIIEVVQNKKFRYFELSADYNILFDNY